MKTETLENLLRQRIEEDTNEASRKEWLDIQSMNQISLYNYRLDHVEIVVQLSKHIAKEVGADLGVVTLAAWLHDVAKPGTGGVQKHGEEKLALKYNDARRDFVKNWVAKRFRKGVLNRVDALRDMISSAKPLRMREKHPPESQIPPFRSYQADFWQGKKV